jgi:Nif-specific regulatory protein
MLRLEVLQGEARGQRLEISCESARIGRSPDADLFLTDPHVSSDHARILFTGEHYLLRDPSSTNGTAIERGGVRLPLDEAQDRQLVLESGDLIELGQAEAKVILSVAFLDDPDDAQVVTLRKIDEFVAQATILERDTGRLRRLYDAQKRIGAASDLTEVLVAIADAAFDLVPGATHVTLVLREDDDEGPTKLTGYVPVLTRARGQSGHAVAPIPISRSVFRKVITERAAVVAADAPREVGETASLVGARIRSVMGVPLWRGNEILGVLQSDNRESAGVFGPQDLEVLAVLAHNASLAVANARLVKRLRAAEERLAKENAFLKGREENRRVGRGSPEILGDSLAMQVLAGQIAKVVDTRVTVLIEGETGVGKELVAAAVHYRSRRRDRLFVTQNCAALPENLLESELFGHRRGSFTGAHEDKKGLFELADGGTLFLDEVAEMPLPLQTKLLRAVQEGEIRPVGATQERRVDVRIVAATNRNLDLEVAAGRFREDLYYRLKVFPLRVPPLRERREDIPLLAEHFLKLCSAEIGKPVAGFAQETMELLQAYDFPGNVRELQNEVQRLTIQANAGDFITTELLSPQIRKVEAILAQVRPTKGTLKERMDQVERWFLLEALRDHGQNKTATAKMLGITREGLHKKLRNLGL